MFIRRAGLPCGLNFPTTLFFLLFIRRKVRRRVRRAEGPALRQQVVRLSAGTQASGDSLHAHLVPTAGLSATCFTMSPSCHMRTEGGGGGVHEA